MEGAGGAAALRLPFHPHASPAGDFHTTAV